MIGLAAPSWPPLGAGRFPGGRGGLSRTPRDPGWGRQWTASPPGFRTAVASASRPATLTTGTGRRRARARIE